MSTAPHQLFLLADHLKLSLLERQRALSLNLEANKQDKQITRSLDSLRNGVEQLESQQTDLGQAEDSTSDAARLRKQYDDLYAQFHNSAPPSSDAVKPNDLSLRRDFAAARTRPETTRQNKNVRFRDNPSEEDDPEDNANRAALFAEQERYRDEPAPSDQAELSNQQIHEYHSQVMRDQDEQLGTLTRSVRNIRQFGGAIGDELELQNGMLEDVERGMDRHETTLERASRRLTDVAKKSKGNWSWITIAILICILIILLSILK